MADREGWINGDEDVDMVGGDGSRENFHILFDTDSADEVFGSASDRPLENLEAILGDPGEMNLEIEDGVRGFAVFIGHCS